VFGNPQSLIRNSKSAILDMPDPQIARRCPSCGASIRVRAFFCPECGNSLEQNTGEQVAEAEAETEKSAIQTKQPAGNGSEATLSESPTAEVLAQVRQRPGGDAPSFGSQATREGKKIRRAAVEAKEDFGQRVDKLRTISSVFIEQAAYDPSLRFLVVAAVLFLLFLAILVLNKLIS
jgi:zinc-ribbon domain